VIDRGSSTVPRWSREESAVSLPAASRFLAGKASFGSIVRAQTTSLSILLRPVLAQPSSVFPQWGAVKSLDWQVIQSHVDHVNEIAFCNVSRARTNVREAVDKNFFRTRIRDDFCL
jgi:hypothetical protein